MAITKTLIQNSASRCVYKLVATAGADTATIFLKTSTGVSMASPGNLTFNAGEDGKGTIARSSGSWVTDLGTTGKYAQVTFTGTTSNNRSFTVISWTASTLTVQETVIAEVVTGAATPTAFKSDIIFPGQITDTPKMNITSMQYSLGGSCSITRNSVVTANMFGNWMDKSEGIGLAENNTFDAVVLFTTAGGTMIIELARVGGFATEDQVRNVWRA